jgi:hypothetical protein
MKQEECDAREENVRRRNVDELLPRFALYNILKIRIA